MLQAVGDHPPESFPQSHRLPRLFVLAVGIGIGIAAFAGAALWWLQRPQPWNTSAITGTVRGVTDTVDDNGSPISVIFNLSLTNKTVRDYRITTPQQLEVFLRIGNALHRAPGSKLDVPLFIPAGETVDARLEVPVQVFLGLLLDGRAVDPAANATDSSGASVSTNSQIPREVTGISIFDHTERYAVNLSKTWR